MGLAFGLALYAAAAPAQGPRITERTKQKQVAESERAGLQKKLGDLKRDIQQTEGAREHAADGLAQSEQAISEANRALHELGAEQQQTRQKLADLTQQQARLRKTVQAQQGQLAELIRQQYVSGNEDHWKLLLSGDNPNRINRELRYLGYVPQAQTRLLETLRVNLREIEANQAQAQNAQDELEEIAQEARDQKALLEKEKAKRVTMLAQLSNKLTAQRKQADGIQRNEQRLGSLVNRLSQLIEEQQKAEAEARKRREIEAEREAERKRLAQREARRAAQQAKNAASQGKPQAKKPPLDAIDDDEPPAKSYGRNELTPQTLVQLNGSERAFAALRGQLRLPVRGELLAKYGSRRNDGPLWKGLFIGAAEGSQIKAVAAGRVVFADWLRGFGNLIIIDHGNQYLSIYGYNQAVLKRSGDAVGMGEIIASAGNSGGHEQSGLYFELRHQGRAFDPLEWISLR
ncbi:murein hydrolase activator EnvC family protein [Noviherbaspirillum sedimenti]|uniref:Protease n=1 Tax=Noviherbaspirillum sedimenti TaxID=2320865 RepID=A0A3A3GCY3_9BURK|nr:peptidoglycan DD-metalloendopeptidase family protein [Noviherbaspirillum sedimenti]RJG04522.1 protease [Noviherbaspirillum sedimenti]